VPADIRADGE